MSFTRACPQDTEGSVDNNFREDSLVLNDKCKFLIISLSAHCTADCIKEVDAATHWFVDYCFEASS